MTLYDQLDAVMPTPVVALNRAIAIGETAGPEAALDELHTLSARLNDYHLLHATRGTMLRRLGQRDAARRAFERASELAGVEADRRFLLEQIAGLAADAAQGVQD